jgi:FlaA1/EpsC-like NDP-sugar epimerase
MKKFLLISMFFISVSSAQAAHEHDEEIVFSEAAHQEFAAIKDDILAIMQQHLDTRIEVVANRKEENMKEVEELRAQLAAAGKNADEIARAVDALTVASVQETITFLDQQKRNVGNRVKELVVLRAPTVLAEDSELKKIFKLG